MKTGTQKPSGKKILRKTVVKLGEQNKLTTLGINAASKNQKEAKSLITGTTASFSINEFVNETHMKILWRLHH